MCGKFITAFGISPPVRVGYMLVYRQEASALSPTYPEACALANTQRRGGGQATLRCQVKRRRASGEQGATAPP